MTPLYKESPSVEEKKDVEPTKITVHIKASQKDKKELSGKSKIKLPSVESVSNSDDNDEF